eukprot:UN34556
MISKLEKVIEQDEDSFLEESDISSMKQSSYSPIAPLEQMGMISPLDTKFRIESESNQELAIENANLKEKIEQLEQNKVSLEENINHLEEKLTKNNSKYADLIIQNKKLKMENIELKNAKNEIS